MSRKLGFSIGYDACDYGSVISHYGIIVVGNTNRIGPYATLHTSTCITDTGRRIGKGLLLSTDAKITGVKCWVIICCVLLIRLSHSSLKGESKRRVDAIETFKIKMEIE